MQAPMGRPTKLEKMFRFLLPILFVGGVIWGASKIINFFAGDVITALQNIYWIVGLGAPLLFLIFYIMKNPTFIQMFFNNLSRKITGFFIKIDPLSYMHRYVDILQEKLANLNEIKVNLEAKRTALFRKTEELKDKLNNSLRAGKTARDKGMTDQASVFGSRAAGAKSSLDLYLPMLAKQDKSLKYLNSLSENWATSIIKLSDEIARKEEEYIVLRDQAKALNQAEAFINGNTEEGRIYQESLKALEESVTQKIAYIEDFEKRSKSIMEGIDVENQVIKDEGLDMLDQYIKNDKLIMPDFSAPLPRYGTVQDIDYIEVQNETKQHSPNKFNLLD